MGLFSLEKRTVRGYKMFHKVVINTTMTGYFACSLRIAQVVIELIWREKKRFKLDIRKVF